MFSSRSRASVCISNSTFQAFRKKTRVCQLLFLNKAGRFYLSGEIRAVLVNNDFEKPLCL